MRQIQRGIFFEDSYLGVTLGGLVFSHGTIMIDAPLRIEDARSWRSMLLNQRGGSNRLLVNLDAHPDRTLGARSLECAVVTHQKAANVFRSRSSIFKGQNMEMGAVWEDYEDAIGLRWAIPDITFSDAMSLHWGGPEVLLEYHPGPSIGAIWAIIPEEKVIFIGDTVVLDQPPFLAEAEIPAWLETLGHLLDGYRDYIIINSRNGLVTVEQVQTQKAYLLNAQQLIQEYIETKEQPAAMEELIPQLLDGLNFPNRWREKYQQRLRYGLYQYHSHHSGSPSPVDVPVVPDSDL
jgi:glyoxylase-like metal-dependent hydrolase (beta-lactamase superfamily II)